MKRAGLRISEAGPHISGLNAKDVKDHLPTEPTLERQAIADYTAADIKLHAAGAIYFLKDADEDIRAKSDPLPGVTSSFAYMRGVLAGMGHASHA